MALFPWSPDSPVLGAVLLLGAVIYLIVVATAYQAVRRLLMTPTEKQTRLGHILTTRSRQSLGQGLYWSMIVVTVYVGLYAGKWIWEPFGELAFEPAFERIPAVATLGGLLLGGALAIEAIRGFAHYLTDSTRTRGIKRVNPQIVQVFEMFFRYVVYLGGGIAAVVVILGMVGVGSSLGERIAVWFATQASALIFIAVLIGIGWAGSRIIRAVSADVGRANSRVSPEVARAMAAVSRGALFTILGLLAVFTVLSAIGLGSVGSTMMVVMSSMIGLVIAMAATGSIGNALAGTVILSFKPIEKGDRVVLLDDTTGDVEEVAIMFTRVRTLAGEVVEVPNNLILSRKIKNLSRSGAHAIIVKLGIGYDISHELVRKLALEAATTTDGINGEPEPRLYARNMGNYAIEYELYAYTRNPRHLKIRSDLLGRLQEVFYAAGVEIMTPDVMVMRKGKTAEEEGFIRIAVAPPLSATAAAEAPAPEAARD